jgi:glucokinase
MGLTIGVDVGGTKIAAGVVDETGTILARTRVPTPADPQWAWARPATSTATAPP